MVVAVCALVFTSSNASAVVIDHFKDGLFTLTVSGTGPATDTSGNISAPQALGGKRDATITFVTGSDSLQGGALLVITGSDHFLSYSDADTVQSTLKLVYGEAAQLDADLSQTGGLAVEYFTSDIGTVSTGWTVRTHQGEGNDTTVTVSMATSAGPSVVFFSWAQFKALNIAFDPSDVDQITFEIDSIVAGDYSIDALDAPDVPEPLTMLGVVMGLGGIGAYIRRRRMA
jgi:chitodextrinase